MLEDPLVRRNIGGGGAMVLDPVDVPDNQVGLPLDGVGVVGAGHWPGEAVDVAEALAAAVAGAVNGAEDGVRVAADELHNVDLARLRPAHLGDVVAERPEGRPKARAAGQLDPRLNPAVPELELVLGEQARRAVLARAVVAG